jgi:tripartite-type tricarboxylate transporter receptor subunit TctC
MMPAMLPQFGAECLVSDRHGGRPKQPREGDPQMTTRLLTALALATAAWLTAAVPATATAAWPERPVQMIIPYPPGGATDVIGRILAQRLSAGLGQPVVVENKGGAGGNIGAGLVAKARNDGYTILMAAMTSHSTMATLEKGRLSYDLLNDLTAVQVVGYVPLVFVVHPSVPAKTFSELVAYAKANPGKLNYASSGAGAPQRMAAELFRKQANAEMIHVPYKGSGPAMTDLVGGQVNLMAETVPAALQFVKSGKLRALAVTTAEKISMLPEVPTVAESGGIWKDFEVVSTFGVMVPQGTPPPVVQRLNAELAKIMQDAEAKEQMLGQGVYALAPQTPDKAAARLRDEVSRWAKVIGEAGIVSDN